MEGKKQLGFSTLVEYFKENPYKRRVVCRRTCRRGEGERKKRQREKEGERREGLSMQRERSTEKQSQWGGFPEETKIITSEYTTDEPQNEQKLPKPRSYNK